MLAGHYTPSPPNPSPPHSSTPIRPLLKLFIWRCSTPDCLFINTTMGSEEGRLRMLPSGNELREPCWYAEKCEWCRKEAGRECCLLQVKLVNGPDRGRDEGDVDMDMGQEYEGRDDGEGSANADKGKGKGKQKADEPQYYPVKRAKFDGDMDVEEGEEEIEF